MLAIQVQFLLGTYQAAAPGRVATAEWPPHPARLHAALVASACAAGHGVPSVEDHAALTWLERQPPPNIAAPMPRRTRTVAPVFVPRNLTPREIADVRNALKAGRETGRLVGRVSRTFPTSVPGDEPVWFQWDADPGEHRSRLVVLAEGVQYLGSSRSPVCCGVGVDTAPPPVALVPVDRGSELALRVPTAGFTDGLLQSEAFPPPTSGVLRAYGTPRRPHATERSARNGPFNETHVLRLEQGFPLDARRAYQIARALREAVLSKAGDDAPAVLHGHGVTPHVAFVALPVVAGPHAAGQVKGVAVVLPADLRDADRERIIEALQALDELASGRLRGRWRLTPAVGDDVPWSLRLKRWTGPTRRWATATPILLDRYPRSTRLAHVELAVRRTFANALLPEPAVVRVSEVGFITGAHHAREYRDHEVPPGVLLHVEATFEEPVQGPLLVGRGRYFGLGLLAAMPEAGPRQETEA